MSFCSRQARMTPLPQTAASCLTVSRVRSCAATAGGDSYSYSTISQLHQGSPPGSNHQGGTRTSNDA